MTPGSLFCSSCRATEITAETRPICAHCGGRHILTAGSIRAAVVTYKRGQLRPVLVEAVKRLLLEAGASWPGGGL